MSSGGLSAERLHRMRQTLTAHVERGLAPGIVTVVGRGDEVHTDAIGTAAVDGSTPMRRDTIFRISSMTKPVTAVAAMILVEECKLRLDDPVDDLLPELADRRVLRRPDGPVDDTVPAKRPITVRDLLTFRLGLGLLMTAEPYPIHHAIDELDIVGFGPPNPAAVHSPDEWLRRLGTLPLVHQPGEGWMYNVGSYVLGVLIARAAGQPFETFLDERVFGPLGMTDTGFSVPASRLDRFATSYLPNPDSGALESYDGAEDSQWARPPAFADGGGGLVSTADDFYAFARMLSNLGRVGDERILSRPSVELMTMNHLTADQRSAIDLNADFWVHHGWGFGVAVGLSRDHLATNPGRYGWDGGLGTSWYNDPSEDLTAVLLTQRMGFPTESTIYRDFWTSVYQAIDD